MDGIVEHTLTTIINAVDIGTMVNQRAHEQRTDDLVEDGFEDGRLAVLIDSVDLRALFDEEFEALEILGTAPLLAEVMQRRILT